MVLAATKVPTLSLESFLALPETKPAQEYCRGIVTQKPMPKGKHSRLQSRLARAIDQVTEEKKIALALTELRCAFGDRSIVPDIAVIRWQNLPLDSDGEIADRFDRAPDWLIEILSPDQSVTLVMEKIIFSLKAGTELAWLVDPMAKSITVFTASLPQVYLAETEIQESLTVFAELENWSITAAEVFDWLKI
ncbi:Uma2 family endonuclease [Synechocystis sp. FACHB-383]|uniref:Uma2 family endonuclease n=1 Tax=Synechocystis sp. FACHB-383 TaxID=2692864 RepID=UPI0016882D5B|nr:Uma2 family endonuclease [Synechocystis sp. FACHB-383]MBD2653748.1 Uma2 family endonuclease [Synechocystis sp. FACHB-383]